MATPNTNKGNTSKSDPTFVGVGEDAGTRKGKMDINTASLEDMMTVEQMTDSRAKAIINHRAAHGPFASINRVRDVPGFSTKLMTLIKTHFEVPGEDAAMGARNDD